MTLFTMKQQTSTSSTPKSAATSEYERLLAAAQAAQSAADRAVADLASIKRTMAEAPRMMQLRREELTRAQEALARAEADAAEAREKIAGKQAEAARLIEVAAEAQRALAQALINQDVMPEGAVWNARPALPMAPAPTAAPQQPVAAPRSPKPAYDPTLGTNRYTPTPAMHPADLHAEVVDYMRERDALCPSCGHSLRGIESARCPGCKLQLSVNVLKSVRSSFLDATKSMWFIRGLAFVGMVLAGYLALVVLMRSKPFGCGVGSDCHFAIRSDWTKVLRIPLAAFAVPVYFALLLASGFVHIGLTDTIRRRAWTVISFAGITVGVAGLWFAIVQFFILKAICPHCLVLDIIGIIVAAIVLRKAPLGRSESLPERAAGPITFPRRKSLLIAGVAAAMVAMVAGVQIASVERVPEEVRKQFSGENNPKPDNGGLLIPALESVTPNKGETTPSNNTKSSQPPIIPKPQPEPVKTTTPAVKTPQKPKEDEGAGGLLLPGLDLSPKPEEPAPQPKVEESKPGAKADEKDKKDGKAPPKFDFSGTLPKTPSK